mgnify:CR=1 FL=1
MTLVTLVSRNQSVMIRSIRVICFLFSKILSQKSENIILIIWGLNLTMLNFNVAQDSFLVSNNEFANCQLFFRCTAERDWATSTFISNLTTCANCFCSPRFYLGFHNCQLDHVYYTIPALSNKVFFYKKDSSLRSEWQFTFRRATEECRPEQSEGSSCINENIISYTIK